MVSPPLEMKLKYMKLKLKSTGSRQYGMSSPRNEIEIKVHEIEIKVHEIEIEVHEIEIEAFF